MSLFDRRSFLKTAAAGLAGLTLDPERLLWVPGAKTIFLPSQTIVEAKTMEEAFSKAFVALFPNGVRMNVAVRAGLGLTLDQRFQMEKDSVEMMGGRIVEHREYVEHQVQIHDDKGVEAVGRRQIRLELRSQ